MKWMRDPKWNEIKVITMKRKIKQSDKKCQHEHENKLK